MATTRTTGDPAVSEEQLADLADKLMARLLPVLQERLPVLVDWQPEGVRVPAQTLELNSVDVEGLLTTTASDNVDKVIPALFAARREFGKLTRNRENTFFGSSYADLAQVLAVTEPGLDKHGLFLDQATLYLKWNGQLEMFLQTRIYHIESLQWLQSWWWVDPPKKDPQGYGSAVTYGRRYPAQTRLGLAGEDDDGNAAGRRDQPPRQSAPAPPPAVEVSDTEREQLLADVAALADVPAVREKWNQLRDAGKLSDELKTQLNHRASELAKEAKEANQAGGEDN